MIQKNRFKDKNFSNYFRFQFRIIEPNKYKNHMVTLQFVTAIFKMLHLQINDNDRNNYLEATLNLFIVTEN